FQLGALGLGTGGTARLVKVQGAVEQVVEAGDDRVEDEGRLAAAFDQRGAGGGQQGGGGAGGHAEDGGPVGEGGGAVFGAGARGRFEELLDVGGQLGDRGVGDAGGPSQIAHDLFECGHGSPVVLTMAKGDVFLGCGDSSPFSFVFFWSAAIHRRFLFSLTFP